MAFYNRTMLEDDEDWHCNSLHALHFDSEDESSTISGLSDSEDDSSRVDFSWPQGSSTGTNCSTCPEVSSCSREAKDSLHTRTGSQATPTSYLYGLPDELVCLVGSYLDVEGLNTGRLLCRRFDRLLSLGEAGWPLHCLNLWKQKIHVDPRAKALLSSQGEKTPSAMKAYRLACVDGLYRQDITPEELCFDPTQPGKGNVLHFRFKESAGPEWTSFDPWHRGQEARQMVFLRDGTVRQLATGPNEDTTGSLQHLRLPFFDATESRGLEIRWKFVRQPMDLPVRGEGAYIRLNVGGRDVPTYIVQRSPNGNWGFLLENCWGLFASFPLPPKLTSSNVRQRRGAMSFGMQLRRSLRGRHRSRDELETDELPQKRRKMETDAEDVLGDDSYLSVTDGWQWREALLYNLGASALPDGDNAVAWERSPQREPY
jgi:hypothetical protein